MTSFLVEGTTFKDKDTAIASLVQAATASTKAFRIVDNRDYRYLVCCASHKGDKGWRKNKDICPNPSTKVRWENNKDKAMEWALNYYKYI